MEIEDDSLFKYDSSSDSEEDENFLDMLIGFGGDFLNGYTLGAFGAAKNFLSHNEIKTEKNEAYK